MHFTFYFFLLKTFEEKLFNQSPIFSGFLNKKFTAAMKTESLKAKHFKGAEFLQNF